MVKSEIVSYKLVYLSMVKNILPCSKYVYPMYQKIFELKDGLGTRLSTLLKADHARVYQKVHLGIIVFRTGMKTLKTAHAEATMVLWSVSLNFLLKLKRCPCRKTHSG